MVEDAWFPINYEILPDVTTSIVQFSGDGWQIIKTQGAIKKVLVVELNLVQSWVQLRLIEEDYFEHIRFGDKEYAVFTSDERILAPALECQKPESESEAMSFSASIRRTRDKEKTFSLSNSIYFEKLSIFLPVAGLEKHLSDDVLLGRYLTGGIHISCRSERRLCSLIPWLTEQNLKSIYEASSLPGTLIHISDKGKEEPEIKGSFRLYGRPDLEAFFKDHVIDIIENQDRYKALGIEFPSAIVLHGPPGCGKTFAAEALVAYLDWPCFTIESGSVGSPYIHQTSKKISEVFENAFHQSPSIIIIDEMEAFLSDREMGGQTHRIEEVAEFLKKIPEALKNDVLIIGMTNRIELIDKAILRRGRFDHVVKVDMPTDSEVRELLSELFSERPCQISDSFPDAVKALTGRPLSDSDFLVRESARLAAKEGGNAIGDDNVMQALNAIMRGDSDNKKKPVGFM